MLSSGLPRLVRLQSLALRFSSSPIRTYAASPPATAVVSTHAVPKDPLADHNPYADMVPSGEVLLTEQPERDLINFPRPEMPMYPGRTRLGFIPEEWFDFFYKKTGITGPYVFGAGLVTTLLSKELWVVEHDFPVIAPLIFLTYLAVKKGGPAFSKMLDKDIDEQEENLVQFQESTIVNLHETIKQEEIAQWQAKGQTLLFEAKREAVKLQLEAEYRRRLMEVYNSVKKRLDYQVEINNARRAVEKKHMVNWIVNNVIKALDDNQEKQNIDRCIANLKNMSLA